MNNVPTYVISGAARYYCFASLIPSSTLHDWIFIVRLFTDKRLINCTKTWISLLVIKDLFVKLASKTTWSETLPSSITIKL